ncbi:MAG: HEPN domain-containing protein [Chloroflexia bacterium]
MGEYLEQAREWFERGDHDLETAQLLYDEGGHADVIAYHIQQAIEKYLKGYLVLHGQRPPRIHELDTLLALASEFQPGLYPSYVELCERATRYYIEGRYPPGPSMEYRRDEIGTDLDQTWQLVRQIRQVAGC